MSITETIYQNDLEESRQTTSPNVDYIYASLPVTERSQEAIVSRDENYTSLGEVESRQKKKKAKKTSLTLITPVLLIILGIFIGVMIGIYVTSLYVTLVYM